MRSGKIIRTSVIIMTLTLLFVTLSAGCSHDDKSVKASPRKSESDKGAASSGKTPNRKEDASDKDGDTGNTEAADDKTGQEPQAQGQASSPAGSAGRAPASPPAAPKPQTPAAPRPQPPEGSNTVKNMLKAALMPVGRCLYVWGGAWNKEDTGAGEEAMSLGVNGRWQQFFDANNAGYDYNKTRYQIHDGLDCTGYLGWTVFQAFGDRYSSSGYVFKSGTVTSTYQRLFGGQYRLPSQVTDYQPCDVMGMNGHVYLVIGRCGDGSVLFLQASPPTVSLCGAPENSEAVRLAEQYMAEYRGECFTRYGQGICSRGGAYLTQYSQFRWSDDVLPDPDGYRNMTPAEILTDLFGK